MVITGNRKDRDLADRISQSTGCSVFPACGDLSMPEIASILSHAKGAVTFDSVWSQLAPAAGIECFVIRENMDINGLKDTALWARSLF
jgi:ADP-heptose:LPS heptosyltransferase